MTSSAARAASAKSSAPSPSYTNTMSRSEAKFSSWAPSLPKPITANGTLGSASAVAARMTSSAMAERFAPSCGTPMLRAA